MSERKWVTREEIAEIHDAVADANLFDDSANYHRQAAADIRATEKLGNKVGNRT